jgi:hypothetical protein
MRVHNWKQFAIQLYVQLYGRRCVICSKPVEIKEAHIEIRNKEHYLMHAACKDSE